MKKSQNGITMTALAVTLIVLAILLAVTINASTELISDSKIKSFITEMYIIQGKVLSMGETLDFEGFEYTVDGSGTSSDVVQLALLKNLGYIKYDNTNTTITVNKIGTKLNPANISQIPGFDENKQKYASDTENINKWYIWDKNVLAANGYNSDMIGDEHYYVNYGTGEIVFNQGFTSVNKLNTKAYSLSEMLSIK